MTEVREARLQMKRNRIVDFGANASRVEMLLQTVAVCCPDDELVVDVMAIRGFRRQRHTIENAGGAEQLTIPSRIGPPAFGPARQVRRLHTQHRRLKRV